jgi:glycosyltransferase involved in cell wall biosynthesis
MGLVKEMDPSPYPLKTGKSAAILAHVLSPNDGRIEKFRRALLAMGFKVDVLSFASARGPYPTLKDARLLAWTGLVPLFCVMAFGFLLIRRPTSAKWETAHQMATALSKRLAMKRVLVSGGYDLVVPTDPETLEPAAQVAAQHRMKLLYDAHEYYPEETPNDPARTAWVHRIHRASAKFVTKFVTVNPQIVALYQQTEPWMPPAISITNATPTQLKPNRDGRLKTRLGLKPTEKVLLFQGGLMKDRGLHDLLAAFQNGPDGWHLAIIGSGPLEDELKQIAGQNVHFLPPVPWAQLADWTQGADLGAILYAPTCANQRLCSPNKLWEFPAAGVPILASDLPFLGMMVTTHGLGWTMPAEATPNDLRQFLLNLSDAELTNAKLACATFSATHTWEAEAARLTMLVTEIFADHT